MSGSRHSEATVKYTGGVVASKADPAFAVNIHGLKSGGTYQVSGPGGTRQPNHGLHDAPDC